MVVEQREIVEVAYQLPGGEIKAHPALIVSTRHLLEEENMFYAVLISTKNLHPEYVLKIEDCWLNKPLAKESYFVTHIVTYFRPKDIIQSKKIFVKKEYFLKILSKII